MSFTGGDRPVSFGVATRVRTLLAHEYYRRTRTGFDFQVSAVLVLGKQISITLFSSGAVRSGPASFPTSFTWRDIYGVSWLGGIGFTKSLFIAGLVFVSSQLMDVSEMGIHIGSLAAGAGGVAIL